MGIKAAQRGNNGKTSRNTKTITKGEGRTEAYAERTEERAAPREVMREEEEEADKEDRGLEEEEKGKDDEGTAEGEGEDEEEEEEVLVRASTAC